MTRCLNCDTSFEGRFCFQCGQSAKTGRLVLGELVRDLVSHWLDLDSRILNTVIGLTRSPGQVCLDYVRGRRIRYVPPLRYFLTILAGIVFLNVFLGFNIADTAADTALTERQMKVEEAVGGFAVEHVDWVVLAALPFFIALVRWLFRGSRFTYTEVGAFVLYVVAQVMLLGFPLAFLRSTSTVVLLIAKMVLQVTVLSWAATIFFEVRPWVGLLKGILATFFYFLLVGLTVLILTLPKIIPLMKAG